MQQLQFSMKTVQNFQPLSTHQSPYFHSKNNSKKTNLREYLLNPVDYNSRSNNNTKS